jgi:4-carboxymuconolactone decarboxylase
MTSPRPSAPRVPPLPEAEWDDKTRELVEAASAGAVGAGAPNIFTTLVRHRRLFRRWSAFGGVLLTGTLPPRDRELVILRAGWLCQSAYEWGQHVRLGRSAGLSDEEIRRVIDGPAAEGWTGIEAALLRATDELHTDGCISEPTWATLAGNFSTEQLIELPMLVGQYHLVAFTLNSLGVQREPGVPDFPV